MKSRKGGRQGRYRRPKETKGGGKGVRASDWLIVPSIAGNRAQRDPTEGRGQPVYRTEEEKDG